MKLIGFEKYKDGTVQEYLPRNEQMKDSSEHRRMFIHMFNAYTNSSAFHFTNEEMSTGNDLYEIFKNKIKKMLFTPCIVVHKPACKLTGKIQTSPRPVLNFIRLEQKENRMIRQDVSFKRASELIGLLYGSGECRLLCDLDDMFLHLVYERAKLVNRQNKVYLYDHTIVIEDRREEVSATLLIPSYTKIDKQNIYDDPVIAAHMQTVLAALKETQIRQIYLVYPKHDKFKKYFTIKLMGEVPLKEDEYRVKVIPYSFSFCTRKQKKTTLTRRQKCR
jgi:hypothetical protein